MRQDRLTLQLLSVMDRLWKEEEGLDLRLNVYNCLSTGVNEGLIEVVSLAETVCRIQMKQADSFVLKVKIPYCLVKQARKVVFRREFSILLVGPKFFLVEKKHNYATFSIFCCQDFTFAK